VTIAAGAKTLRGRELVVETASAVRSGMHNARFARAKFRPPPLPAIMVTRPPLQDRLLAGSDQRLTVVVGSAGAGKSVLLSSWAAARAPQVTAWLSCDEADANPVRFWTGFIEAPRLTEPRFGAEAAELLSMDGTVSADVTASIANDAAMLPPGSAVVVDDFHYAAPSVSGSMRDLVERWPAEAAQLVLASRVDPALRLHRLRLAGQLCELRDHDLQFSVSESRDLLAGFGVDVTAADLALLQQRSEGWAAALQMAALSLRSAGDPGRAARALEVRGHAIAEYFVTEVLDLQPPEISAFMLDTSILGELTAESCAAVTGRGDAATLLRALDAANLFVVALDEERASFRYHHLVRQMLRTELRTRDPARERALQLRAAEWFESTGDARRAARHFLAARQADRALALLQDQVVADYLRDPVLSPPPDLGMIDPALAAEAPDRLLALALDLGLSGAIARTGEYLDLLERALASAQPEPRLAARFTGTRAAYRMMTGRVHEAVSDAVAARAIIERAQISDDWISALPIVLLRGYTWLQDYAAVDGEATAALAAPELSEPVKLVMVPGAQALAWSEAGHLSKAADAAQAAGEQAQRLGFDRHFFAIDHLRALSGLALERRDLDEAEQLCERALWIAEQGRPSFEFLVLLERAAIWAARGEVRDALAAVGGAREVLPGTGSELLARADELEAALRLSLGDLDSPVELAEGLSAARRALVLARVALAAGDHQAARKHLQAPGLDNQPPRLAQVRQILLASAAIARGDPAAPGIVGNVIDTARRDGFVNTVVTTAPQMTSYLAGNTPQSRPGPFTKQLIAAALDVRAAQPEAARPGHALIEPLTAAEQRILQLLPTSTYLQIAATLYISRNTVKTHLHSIYHKLGVTSRAQAIERATDLRIL
jgi:LuxR family transcriptional regulator, maltose regulon positive regulatory protein